MNYSFEENELLKFYSQCGIVKMKTKFYFGNVNQNFRKECIKCTSIKQKEWTYNIQDGKKSNKQYFQQNKENIFESRKQYSR